MTRTTQPPSTRWTLAGHGPPGTAFDHAVAKATEIAHELRRVESNTKLAAAPFMLEAMRMYNCTAERLALVEQLLDTRPNLEATHVFCRRMTAFVRSANCPSPPRDPIKMQRIYGRDDLAGELAQTGITAAELIALATRRCIDAHPDAFGVAESSAGYQEQLAILRERLATAHEAMRSTWAMADVVVDGTTSPADRDRGLVRLTFREHPTIALLPETDWPRLITDAVLAAAGLAADQAPAASKLPEDQGRNTKRGVKRLQITPRAKLARAIPPDPEPEPGRRRPAILNQLPGLAVQPRRGARS